MGNHNHFYLQKAGNKKFWHFTSVINQIHQFFTCCLHQFVPSTYWPSYSSAYWVETWFWLGTYNFCQM